MGHVEFQELKEKNCQPGIYIWQKSPSKNEGEMKPFFHEEKRRQFASRRPAFKE
jgi:hypothetical protein